MNNIKIWKKKKRGELSFLTRFSNERMKEDRNIRKIKSYYSISFYIFKISSFKIINKKTSI